MPEHTAMTTSFNLPPALAAMALACGMDRVTVAKLRSDEIAPFRMVEGATMRKTSPTTRGRARAVAAPLRILAISGKLVAIEMTCWTWPTAMSISTEDRSVLPRFGKARDFIACPMLD